jgi:predicted dehydrogenase
MTTYRAALIGCGRIGAFIDNESTSPHAWSHAAGYVACPRTELAALSDQRAEVMDRAGERYGVPPERRYRDYREMLERERPQIVSVATQPEQRAEIVIYAAEHGARAIYAEKPMAASLEQADAMVAAVERHGIAFNMGTNRRWEAPYDAMKELIHGGRYGRLLSMTIHQGHGLFNMGSHVFDLFLWLNDDQPVEWVQFHLTNGGDDLAGGLLDGDPSGGGRLQFANGVAAFASDTGRPFEVEAVCEQAVISSLGSDNEFLLRESGGVDHRGNPTLRPGSFPPFTRSSSTVNLIMDLAHALDTGQPPRGGVRIARANTELIFACIESHRRGGARVRLPLEGSDLRLKRHYAPRQPRFER